MYPFLLLDEDLGIISLATQVYALLRGPKPGEAPFCGVENLLSIVDEVPLEQLRKAAILRGLILLGDRRLLPLLNGCWRRLGPDGRQVLSQASSGLVTVGLVEFLLDWLEQADNEGDFGAVVAAFCKMPELSTQGAVAEIERAIPCDPRAPVQLIRSWTFPDYLELIRPQLERLAKRETEPKVIPFVFEHWAGSGAENEE
jgi:hypothetical protein